MSVRKGISVLAKLYNKLHHKLALCLFLSSTIVVSGI